MDFRFTLEEEAFRQEVRDFLEKEPPESFPVQIDEDGYGMGGWSNEYHRKLGEKGWIALMWPKDCGGQERSPIHYLIMMEELAYARAPAWGSFMTSSMGHSVALYGSERVKREILPRMAKGETTFWMALSEPEAGSDLLALQTKAVEDGDDFVINGQKVWSSLAQFADYGFLAARTDLAARPSRGMSVFIIPRQAPGVTVRPLYNIAGDHYHNEVFLDDVRVPKDYLVGEKNRGFAQMFQALEFDRFWSRFCKVPFCRRVLEELIEYAKETKAPNRFLVEERLLRHKLAEIMVEIEVCQMLFYRAGWMLNKGFTLRYEASVGKVFADEMGQRLFNLGMQMLGLYGQLEKESKWAPLRGSIERLYLYGPGHTIAGGTSEINRNTIAQFGLGLPR